MVGGQGGRGGSGRGMALVFGTRSSRGLGRQPAAGAARLCQLGLPDMESVLGASHALVSWLRSWERLRSGGRWSECAGRLFACRARRCRRVVLLPHGRHGCVVLLR